MTEQPPAKKIKISLEPFIDNHVADITNLGQEILKTEVSLPEKLMQSVDRIWFERGEWKDITEASLKQAIEEQQGNEHEDQNVDKQDAPSILPNMVSSVPPGFDIIKLRESVINKLFHAKSEIDVALDVINILAASNRASATTKDLVLPAGSLTATYVTKPKQTMKAQLESTQLNLGLKRTKQKQAADFLKNSAATLKGLVEKEQVFWNEALDLRRNNWQMFPGHQLGNANTGSSFFVQYGFAEIGSDFNESSMGELKRANDTAENNLQLSLPHANSRQVVVSISQSHMGQLKIGRNRFSEGILGMIDEIEKKDTVPSLPINTSTHSKVQAQLENAHATVFDAELFADILAEAQALSSNVRFPDDEIVINIDGHIDLSIRKEPVENKLALADSSASIIISRSINLAFRLLLLQHQRYNAWKQKAKYLSTNPEIHPMLAQHDASLLISSAATAAAAASTTNSSTQVNNTVNGATTVANGIQSPKVGQSSIASGTSNANAALSTTTPNVGNATVTAGTSLGTATVVAAAAAASGNVTGAIGGSTSVGSVASATMRARTKSPNQIAPRALPQQIPILLPILSLTRFWVQFDRVRQVIHHLISPLCASIAIATHFKCELLSMPSSKKSLYDAYPGYTELSLSLGISLLKGPSLKFGLDQSGSISVCLPQTTIVLQNVSEFESFLSREIKVICLQTVCNIANDIISRHGPYLEAIGTANKQRFLWQVNKVDEAIHGSVWWSQGGDHVWRNITVCMKHLGPSYSVQFQLGPTDLLEEKIYTIELGQHTSTELAMSFKEKVFALVKLMIDDAMMTP
ncbi:subunit 17 of mediator complex-domain-containing protein [Blakeslea trispora]|nr:subunit 17 of mediator complex-domain-containing protein [Blakeslea trispora]